MRRCALHDEHWDRIKDFLPGPTAHVGGTAADKRLVLDAVLYRYRAGSPGVICPSVSGAGRLFINASAGGQGRSLRAHFQAVDE